MRHGRLPIAPAGGDTDETPAGDEADTMSFAPPPCAYLFGRH